MSQNPKISVLMPVYNGETYLKEAINSILSQTYTDFEFLIINDGSTDKSLEIIESYNDQRIRLINNDGNIGLIKTLNKGLDMAKGEYIARMDADDISLPERFEKQVKYMDENPDIAICGTSVKIIGLEREIAYKKTTNPELNKCKLLFEGYIVHPTVFIRTKAIRDFNLYYPDYKYAEDYGFWVEVSKHFKLANVEDVLLLYRMHPAQISSDKKEEQLNSDLAIKLNLYKEIGLETEENEYGIIKELASYSFPANKEFVTNANNWFNKIRLFNEDKKYCDHNLLMQVLSEKWYEVCLKTGQKGLWNWSVYFNSPLSYYYKMSNIVKIKFLFNLILGKIGLLNLIRFMLNCYRNYKYKTKWR
jgi:glycosyltransferase involved in cell wall biosynthesis